MYLFIDILPHGLLLLSFNLLYYDWHECVEPANISCTITLTFGSVVVLYTGGRAGISQWQSAGLVGSSPRVKLFVLTYFGICSSPVIPQ